MNKLRFDRETNLVLRYYLYKKSEKTIYDLNYQKTLSFIDSLLLRNIFLFSFNVTRNTQIIEVLTQAVDSFVFTNIIK